MIKVSILQRAIKEAKSSDVCRGKVGAVIFTNSGHIVTSAHNTTWYGETHLNVWTIHAERFALDKAFKIKATERYGKLSILVVRYKPSSDLLANAKPCLVCARYLQLANVAVYYSDVYGNISKL